VSGSVSLIHYRIDINTLEHHDATELHLNEIGSCTVSVNAPVVFDPDKTHKHTGFFIIIDRLTNGTVGAGMITGGIAEEHLQSVSIEERVARFSQTATAIALSGSTGKEIAYHLERKLFDNGHAATILEIQDASLIKAIKNAGLICLCVNVDAEFTDIGFDAEQLAVETIYGELRQRKIIV
jgi:bifunctional enzyme CysN/CysC